MIAKESRTSGRERESATREAGLRQRTMLRALRRAVGGSDAEGAAGFDDEPGVLAAVARVLQRSRERAQCLRRRKGSGSGRCCGQRRGGAGAAMEEVGVAGG